MSDFRPKVEIWLFRARATKNVQYDPYLWPNSWNVRVVKEIGVEEHNGDVKYQTGSKHMAVLRMHNENYAI